MQKISTQILLYSVVGELEMIFGLDEWKILDETFRNIILIIFEALFCCRLCQSLQWNHKV